MAIDNIVKKLMWGIALPVTLGLSVGLSVPLSMNIYRNHNVCYETKEKKVFKKIDGIFDYTEVEINKDNSIKVIRSHFLNYRSYTDKDRDGRLDRIYSGGGPLARGIEGESRDFYRKDDLETYPEIFASSEKDYKKQLERFGILVSL